MSGKFHFVVITTVFVKNFHNSLPKMKKSLQLQISLRYLPFTFLNYQEETRYSTVSCNFLSQSRVPFL